MVFSRMSASGVENGFGIYVPTFYIILMSGCNTNKIKKMERPMGKIFPALAGVFIVVVSVGI
jgi:hypothetical protein